MESEESGLRRDVSQMKEGAVTLFDVLGWKGIWQRKPDAMETLARTRKFIEDLQKIDVEQIKKIEKLELKVWGFSDTIILTTFGEPDLVLPFHANASRMLLFFCLEEGLPLRGAIGFGRFSSIENMLVGPAVDEVASWYEAVDWIGAILTPTASFHHKEEDYEGIYEGKIVLEYPVSVRSGARYVMKCVDWFAAIEDEEELLKKFLTTATVITPDIASKYQNTVDFFRFVQKLKESGKTVATRENP